MSAQTLRWNNHTLRLARMDRKTIGIYVKNTGTEVRIPRRLSQGELMRFLQQKSDWIEKSIRKQQARQGTPKQFVNGEYFLYLGRRYRLCIEKNLVNQAVFRQDQLWVGLEQPDNQSQVIGLIQSNYQRLSTQFLTQQVNVYASIVGVWPNEVRIRGFKSMWGNCNHLGRLQLNARLIMAPIEAIDYVVVHELAHLIHLNHSKQFWAVVASVLPNYKAQRQWLKENGHTLRIDIG